MVRILIVDDHEPIRRNIRLLLAVNAEWLICGEAVDGRQAISKCLLLDPHLIVLDIHMPVMNGFDAAKHILRCQPKILVLMLTNDDGPAFAAVAAASGAHGFLSESNAGERLALAISALLRGEQYFPASPPVGDVRPS